MDMFILLGLLFAGSVSAGIGLAVRERRRSQERAMAEALDEPIRPASLGGPLPPRPPVPAARPPLLSSATLASKVREACGHSLNEAKEVVEAMGRAGIKALPDPWSLEREAPEPSAGLAEWKAFQGRVDILVASIDARRPPRRRDVVSGRVPASGLYPTPRPAAGVPSRPRASVSVPASRSSSGFSSDDGGFSAVAAAAVDASDAVGGGFDGGGCSDAGGDSGDSGSCSSD